MHTGITGFRIEGPSIDDSLAASDEVSNGIQDRIEDIWHDPERDGTLSSSKKTEIRKELIHKGMENDLIPVFDLRIDLEWVYQNYANAMKRRFNRTPLEYDRFIWHVLHNSHEQVYAHGNYEDGYVFGYLRHGVFFPSHFAPATMRGGVRLFYEMGENINLPIALGITGDLWNTLKKIGSWSQLDVAGGLRQFFMGLITDKKFVHNSHPFFEDKEKVKGIIDAEMTHHYQ